MLINEEEFRRHKLINPQGNSLVLLVILRLIHIIHRVSVHNGIKVKIYFDKYFYRKWWKE